MPKQQFAREADMLSQIADHARYLLQQSGDVNTFFEVQAPAGIPDVVLVQFNQSEVAKRYKLGLEPVLDLPSMSALITLQTLSRKYDRTGDGFKTSQISSLSGVSPGHLSSSVLPKLAHGGHLERVKRGYWTVTYSNRSLARKIVTVEAKIRDWRSGYSQTLRHRISADQAWLVLDSGFANPALAHSDWFRQGRIGLATLHEDHGLRPKVTPPQRIDVSAAYRELLAERAFLLHRTGQVSGPVQHVFGAHLTTTTGSDPRLVGASER